MPNSDAITSEGNENENYAVQNIPANNGVTSNVDQNVIIDQGSAEREADEDGMEKENETSTEDTDTRTDGEDDNSSEPKENNACLEEIPNSDGIPSCELSGEKNEKYSFIDREIIVYCSFSGQCVQMRHCEILHDKYQYILDRFLSLIRKAVYREKSTMAISSRSSTDETSLCRKSIESTTEILVTVQSTEHPEQEQIEINATSLIDKPMEEHGGIKLNDTKAVHLYADLPQVDNTTQETECSRTQVANGTNRETSKEKKLKTSDSRKGKTKEPGTTSHGTIRSKETLKNRKSTTKLRANHNLTEESRQSGAVKKLSPQKYPKEGENCIEKKKSHFLKEENSQSFNLSACRPKESTDSPLLMRNAFLLKHGDLQLVVKDSADYSFSYTTSPKYDDQGNTKYHKQEFSLKKNLSTEEQ
ncbi:hypothetical protein CDAR_81501 [Caerostris darwini]|uniref:Uncharacterized protein n=1 Tax=Caerostris darwini TaxID=1538125 RepID=A0AAV4Q3G6_9ARAC|nr:hypothetical protein CDAR_81501 [Caerostris darwini]